MENERDSAMSYGWIFIVLLLFFGIFGGGFGCGNGLFGRGGCGCGGGGAAALAGTELADLVALRSVLGHKTMSDNCQTDRDVLELKCNMTSQNAVMTQQLDTAFRTIISNQDAGFSALRTQMLEDQIRNRDMTLIAQNSEIQALKTQMHNDNRFNALERSVEAGFCQTVKRPPYFPAGCSPCVTPVSPCGFGGVAA